MTASDMEADVESVLGRDVDGVAVGGGRLISISLTDGDSLTESERETIESEFGVRLDRDGQPARP